MSMLLACPFCGSKTHHTEKCYFSVMAAFKNSQPGDLTLIPDLADAWNSRDPVDATELPVLPEPDGSLDHEGEGFCNEDWLNHSSAAWGRQSMAKYAYDCVAHDRSKAAPELVLGYMVASFDGPDGYEFVYRQVCDNMSVLDRSNYVIKQVLLCVDSDRFPFN